MRGQDDDLASVASLGVRVWRYGMPWRLAEPEPGVYDWSLWDRALAACERHDLVPVVDLCHFGLPDHDGGFADPRWIEGFVRYVDAFLARGPRWLDQLVAAIDRIRADQLPARGLCWYSRGDQYDWHTMLTVPIDEVTEVGLFDASRRPRPVAADDARLAARPPR